MGQMLAQALAQAVDCQLVGAVDVAESVFIGNDATGFLGQASGVMIQSDLHVGLKNAQVLIDFTRPEGTMAHVKVCRELGVKMVIGTTGFSDTQKADITAASHDIAISVGGRARGVAAVAEKADQEPHGRRAHVGGVRGGGAASEAPRRGRAAVAEPATCQLKVSTSHGVVYQTVRSSAC
jgi:hypothetical protein